MRSVLYFFVLLCANAIGQTGPGGVGNSTSNVLWLSADRGVYSNAGTTPALNGNDVQQWNDRSGNARHAGEATVGNRPNYYTNVLNGAPAIRWSASSTDRLLSTGLTTGNQASVFVVARYSSLPSPNPGLVQASSSGNGFSSAAGNKHIGMWINSTNTRPWGRGVRSDGTSLEITQTTATAANTFYIFNNNYGAATIQQYIDNTAAGSVASDGTLRSWTDMAIGVQAGTESWNGDIAEVIAFNTSLNSAQRLIVANYLSAKYGMALGTGDIYLQDNAGNGNFDHEVAGIGRVDASNVHTDARGGVVQIGKAAYAGLDDNEFLLWGHNNGALGAFGVTDRPSGVSGRWARVWRVSEVNAAGTGVNVGNTDVTFDLSTAGPVNAADLCLLVDSDNDGLFSDETPVTGATHIGGNLYRFANTNAMQNARRFTLGSTSSSTPLPIELLSFTAREAAPNTVDLEWSTATESNNDHFTVERSANGTEWAEVEELPGAGNSSTTVNYATADRTAFGPVFYYRLRQTDTDGASTLSDVMMVNMGGIKDVADYAYPNPFTGPFTVVLHGLEAVDHFEMIGADGRSYPVQHTALGGGSFRIDPADLPQGRYVLRASVPDGARMRAVNVVH